MEQTTNNGRRLLPAFNPKAKARYYDTPCAQCATCSRRQPGNYPDGRPYEACRAYGYILHYDKGISEERCELYSNTESTVRPRALSMRDLKKQRKHE